MKNSLVIGLIVAVLLTLMGSVFVVREDQTAMVLNLGRVVRADLKPGLHFKVPLVERTLAAQKRWRKGAGRAAEQRREGEGEGGGVEDLVDHVTVDHRLRCDLGHPHVTDGGPGLHDLRCAARLADAARAR